MPSRSIEFARRPIDGVVAHLNRPAFDEEEGPPRDPHDVARTDFPLGVRGYDRAAVDAHLEDVQRLVDELRAGATPSHAVRQALDEVGEETSAILRRAHDAADEITVRSRAEADRRTEESERSATATLAAAEARAQQLDEEAARRVEEARQSAVEIRAAAEAQVIELDKDTDRIWAERQRLLDDVERTSGQLVEISRAASRRFPGEEETDDPALASEAASLDAPPQEGDDSPLPSEPAPPRAQAPWETIAFDPLEGAEEPSPSEPRSEQ